LQLAKNGISIITSIFYRGLYLSLIPNSSVIRSEEGSLAVTTIELNYAELYPNYAMVTTG